MSHRSFERDEFLHRVCSGPSGDGRTITQLPKPRTVLRVEKCESGRIYIHDVQDVSVAEAWMDDGNRHIVITPSGDKFEAMLLAIANFYL